MDQFSLIKRSRTVMALAATLLLVPALSADPAKLSPELKGLTGASKVEVIIQYKTLPATQQESTGLISGLLATAAGLVGTVLNSLGAILTSVTAGQLNVISDDPNVVYSSRGRTVSGSSGPVTLGYWYPTTYTDMARSYGYT